jgi:hypothetical protein
MTAARVWVARVAWGVVTRHDITSSCYTFGFECVKIRHVRLLKGHGSILISVGFYDFDIVTQHKE